MPAFDYAIVRLVPRVEREEFLNVGVVVFCPAHESLVSRFEIDEARIRGFAPSIDLDLVRTHLDAFARAAGGEGPIGALPLRERWHWLVAPKSTILQTSAAHVGIADDPAAVLEDLLVRYVRST